MAISNNIMKDLMGYLPEDRILRMYDLCRNERDRLLIRLLMRTGRRITEILGRKSYKFKCNKTGYEKTYTEIIGLRPKDINFEDRNILWNILKKKKPLKKLKPIDETTLEMLKQYIETRGIKEDEPIFKINRRRADQIVKDVAERAGIYHIGEKKPHCHHFRHSFAVNVLKISESPADLRYVQQVLEHSSISITEAYLQFGEEGQRRLIESIYQGR